MELLKENLADVTNVQTKPLDPAVEEKVLLKANYAKADPAGSKCPFAVIPDDLKLDPLTFIVDEEHRKYFDYIIIPDAMLKARV